MIISNLISHSLSKTRETVYLYSECLRDTILSNWLHKRNKWLHLVIINSEWLQDLDPLRVFSYFIVKLFVYNNKEIISVSTYNSLDTNWQWFLIILSTRVLRRQITSQVTDRWDAFKFRSSYLNCCMALFGFEPMRSNLLIKVKNGTLYRFICLFTVTVWHWTPPTAHNTRMAPSRTLSDLSTSIVKSTCPIIEIIVYEF